MLPPSPFVPAKEMTISVLVAMVSPLTKETASKPLPSGGLSCLVAFHPCGTGNWLRGARLEMYAPHAINAYSIAVVMIISLLQIKFHTGNPSGLRPFFRKISNRLHMLVDH